ncbi:hypothetical protein J4217_04075 [Candidatus Pacearchaeota archaeon]|nr:hypothetical protein [Candidatus Pacearchaeota archaeon]
MQLNMQLMRYINLLDKVTGVKTTRCFFYNNAIIFAVPKGFMAQAIGKNASNIYYLQEKMGKRVRIVQESNGTEDIERFVRSIIEPAQFKSIEIKENELIITAGSMQNKANLLGRNKKRFEELKEIIRDDFSLELKVM